MKHSPDSLFRRSSGLPVGISTLIGITMLVGCSSSSLSRWSEGWRERWQGASVEASGAQVYGTLHVIHQRRGDSLPIAPAVVYLEPAGRALAGARHRAPVQVEHAGNGFAPALAAVGPGQGIVLKNTGAVHHRVFWLQAGQRFEVDLPPGAVAPASLAAGTRGVVRFYCQLHEDEYFSVHVSPSPHFALLQAPGPYVLDDVAPGVWRLAIWSEAVAGGIRELSVDAREESKQDLWIDARLVRRR